MDARRVEWASRRLALCNMEWNRITASDIYVILSSFKPPAPAGFKQICFSILRFTNLKRFYVLKSYIRAENISGDVTFDL